VLDKFGDFKRRANDLLVTLAEPGGAILWRAVWLDAGRKRVEGDPSG
jgi:hypothetical protein